MSNRSSAGARRSSAVKERVLDAEEALESLRALIAQVASPVVQECLRAARCEIAYLTATDGSALDEEEGAEAEAAQAMLPVCENAA